MKRDSSEDTLELRLEEKEDKSATPLCVSELLIAVVPGDLARMPASACMKYFIWVERPLVCISDFALLEPYPWSLCDLTAWRLDQKLDVQESSDLTNQGKDDLAFKEYVCFEDLQGGE